MWGDWQTGPRRGRWWTPASRRFASAARVEALAPLPPARPDLARGRSSSGVSTIGDWPDLPSLEQPLESLTERERREPAAAIDAQSSHLLSDEALS